MYRVQKGIDKGKWIPVELHEKLEQNWEDSKWKDKAEVISKIEDLLMACCTLVGQFQQPSILKD